MTTVFDLELPTDCPPSGAREREQIAFRLVHNNPPTSADFLTHQELHLALKADACRRAAVSIFQTQDHARRLMAVAPHLGVHIAVAYLSADHGKISHPQARSGHMDWWPYSGMRRPIDFKVLEP